MQVEQPLPAHKETHFVFAVGVLVEELLAEGILVRMVRGQADYVGGLEAAFLLQSLYLVCVGFQNLFLGGRSRQLPGWPLLKAHTMAGQRIANHLRSEERRVGKEGRSWW